MLVSTGKSSLEGCFHRLKPREGVVGGAQLSLAHDRLRRKMSFGRCVDRARPRQWCCCSSAVPAWFVLGDAAHRDREGERRSSDLSASAGTKRNVGNSISIQAHVRTHML